MSDVMMMVLLKNAVSCWLLEAYVCFRESLGLVVNVMLLNLKLILTAAGYAVMKGHGCLILLSISVARAS